MVRIYLDIETYRPNEAEAFVNEKVISSGLLVDETPYNEDSLRESVKPVLICEWNGLNEREIINKLQGQVNEIQKNHSFVVICGFNILRFDIPLLLCKYVEYSLNDYDVVAKVWNDCFIIDYFQQLLIANKNYFKGLSLEKIYEVSKNLGLKPPVYNTNGSVIKELYEQRKYTEIEEHLKQDLRMVRWLDLYGAKRLIEKSIKEQKPLFKKNRRILGND